MAGKGLAHVKCVKPIKQGETTELSIDLPQSCYVCGLSMMRGDFVLHFDDEIHSPKGVGKNWNEDFLGSDKVPEYLDEKVPMPPKPTIQMVDSEGIAKKLLDMLLPLLSDKILPDMLPSMLLTAARQAVAEKGEPLKIQINDLPTQDVGLQHKKFPSLLRALLAGVNVWLAGPSGSGKTTAAMNAARAMSVQFYYTGAVGDPYGLMGFKTALGEYARTPFREAWEHGGMFLWDEIDASDPNALLAFNAALANGQCAFPDKVVARHAGCLIVAAANTWGHGATTDYVGRNKIDSAFLKRFAFLDFDYDEDLEIATCTNKEWCRRVQEVRAKVKAKKLRVLVTPRETYIGEKLLAAGLEQPEVESMTIRSGMSDAQWTEVGGAHKPLTAGVQIKGRRPFGSGGRIEGL